MKITTLKDKLNRLIVEIGKTNNSKLLEEALDILLLAAEIERDMEFSQQIKSNKHIVSDDDIANEINKVTRKLPKWAERPNQTNTKILTLYLELKRKNTGVISKDFFQQKYDNTHPDGSSFYSSYNQMKSISDRNNGKIFDEVGGIIEIWQPVKEAVKDFERLINMQNRQKRGLRDGYFAD